MRLTNCQTVREYLLAAGWDAEQRRQAAEVLRHAEGCAECRSALDDFDRLRQTLSPHESAGETQPDGGWDAMQARMTDMLQSHASRVGDATRALRMIKPPRPVVRPSLAIAAALTAVAAATFQISRYFTPLRSEAMTMAIPVFLADPQRVEPAMTRISDRERAHEVEMFRKIGSGRDGRPGWMMVSNSSRRPQVGLITSAAMPSDKLLLLRLALWHGRDLVSTSDLLVVAGQKADWAVPVESGQTLHYRIDAQAASGINDAANLYLWLEVKTTAGAPLGAMVTNLQIHPEEVLTAGKLTTTVGEFELRMECKNAGMAEERP